MKKISFVTLFFTLIVLFGLVSCDSESLGKVGEFMSGFAGTDAQSIKYSEKEVKAQTESVKSHVEKVQGILSVEIKEDSKSKLIGLIDSIIDNPACDLEANSGVNNTELFSFIVKNNPLGEGSDSLLYEFNRQKTELEESLGEDTVKVMENIINVLTAGANDFTGEGEATIGDVAKASSLVLMCNSLNEIFELTGDKSQDFSDDEVIKQVLEKITEFDDAAKTYMRLTGTPGLAILDSLDVESLAGEEQE